MQRKAPAMRSIGIDRDQRALDRFRCDYPVELVHGCAHEFLASFAFRGTELVYSDPPYLHLATRRSNRRYRYEYTDAGDHADPSRSAQEPGVPGDGLGTPRRLCMTRC